MFSVGVYVGLYLDQHYQVPKVDDPQALWEKLKDLSEKYKKDK